jgi:glucose/arabinose dehydrogenase
MKKAFSTFCFLFSFGSIIAQPAVSLNEVITGLSQTMQIVHAGDGSNRMFIPQKGGAIKVFDKNFSALGTFLTVTGISTGGEQGLLSLCFHPQYKTNGFFFVYYTTPIGDLEVARYKVGNTNDSANLARPLSKKIVITIPHPTYVNHNGGTLRFGKDGYLYLSTGDGGGSGDPSNNAQNNSVLLGKMLRLNVNTSETTPFYTIPPGNIVLPGNTSANTILSTGLRNPFRWNFDRLKGDMWIGDVGQNSFEEFNHCLSDSLVGINFGWKCFEGNKINSTAGCSAPKYKFPFLTYPTLGSSAIGGTVYRGETFLSMKGYYLGADFYSGQLFKVKYDTLTKTYSTSSQVLSVNGIADIGEAEDGELYIPSLYSGTVYRVQANGPVQYTFTGNGNWSNPLNWSNNTLPPLTSISGSIIAIRPIVGGECIVNTPVTIAAGTKLLIENNKVLRMVANLTMQ